MIKNDRCEKKFEHIKMLDYITTLTIIKTIIVN